MREIGRIVRLQIQRSSLKTGEKPDRVYDPAPLVAVPRLAITPDGALGEGPDRSWLVDVHHRAHPATKNEDGEHGISVGFTAHYAAMRDRFGDRIVVGCAGENIIAETARTLASDDLSQGLAVLDAAGREALRLAVLDVAHPCRPFTGWALGRRVEPEALREHLQFLDGGMRGYYCVAETAGIVSVGDRLAVL
ncbi:MAG: MOSC domain-containing protein [Gemmatimonadales bacterium]